MKKRRGLILPLLLCVAALTACNAAVPAQKEGLTRVLLAAQTTPNNPAGEGYTPVVQTDRLSLEINPDTTHIRVTVRETGYVWSTAARQPGDETVYPLFSITYRDSKDTVGYMDSSADCVSRGQYRIEQTAEGARVDYTLGTVLKNFIFPTALTPDRYEYFLQKADDSQKSTLEMFYRLIDFSQYDEVAAQDLANEYPQAVNGQVYGLRNKTMNDVLKLEVATLFEELGYSEDDMNTDGLRLPEENAEDTPVFNLSVYYTLEDGQLVVRVPQSEIQMPATIRLETLSLPTCFTGEGGADGYFLLPDGSGSIMSYRNGKSDHGAYRVQLFGQDYALSRDIELTKLNAARLNLYGCREGENAYLALVEDSQAYTNINAVTGTSSQTPRVWPEFAVSVVDYMTSAGKTSTSSEIKMAVYPSRRYDGEIRLRYVFLTGDSADYSGMAAWYRQYLFGSGKMPDHAGYPLTAETIGLIREEKYLLGIPYSVDSVLTGFSQSAAIAEDLLASGVQTLNLKLSGWCNGGYRQGLLTSGINPEKKLGGEEGLRALASRLGEKGVEFYPDTQLLYANASDVSLGRKYTVGMLNEKQGLLYRYDLATFMRTAQKDRFILNAGTVAKSTGIVRSFLDNYSLTAVSLGSTGSDLSADYNPSSIVHRQDNIVALTGVLRDMKDSGARLMLSAANAYALPYADVAENIPLRSDRYSMTDYSVPFYAMTLSGYVGYTAPAVNTGSGERADLLHIIENGAAPLYILTAESLIWKSAGEYDTLYATEYNSQKQGLLSVYGELKDAVGTLYGSVFLRHEKVADNVFLSVFSRGAVYVNYNEYSVTVDGTEIPGLGYIRSEEALQ